MKCPKCGYLGYDHVDRCRNCGYEFSLATPAAGGELTLRPGVAEERAPDDLPLFGLPVEDDVPLITRASPPRPPLAVRRATPEVPRLRAETLRTPVLDFPPPEERRPAGRAPTPARAPAPALAPQAPAEAAGFWRRGAALLVDGVLLLGVDAAVIYFTMQVCGLGLREVRVLPKAPLLVFLLAQNAAYLVAFTLGGQTLGKMAAGIRVVAEDAGERLGLGRCVLRTLVWGALAVPAGLGFLSIFFGRDHRGLHDRFAGTRVVRVS